MNFFKDNWASILISSVISILITAVVVALSVGGEVTDELATWLSALGTIGAAIAAVYYGSIKEKKSKITVQNILMDFPDAGQSAYGSTPMYKKGTAETWIQDNKVGIPDIYFIITNTGELEYVIRGIYVKIGFKNQQENYEFSLNGPLEENLLNGDMEKITVKPNSTKVIGPLSNDPGLFELNMTPISLEYVVAKGQKVVDEFVYGRKIDGKDGMELFYVHHTDIESISVTFIGVDGKVINQKVHFQIKGIRNIDNEE